MYHFFHHHRTESGKKKTPCNNVHFGENFGTKIPVPYSVSHRQPWWCRSQNILAKLGQWYGCWCSCSPPCHIVKQCKWKTFMVHQTDGLYIFYSNLWNLLPGIMVYPLEMSVSYIFAYTGKTSLGNLLIHSNGTGKTEQSLCQGICSVCHSGHVLQCPELCAGQRSVQWGVWHGNVCASTWSRPCP